MLFKQKFSQYFQCYCNKLYRNILQLDCSLVKVARAEEVLVELFSCIEVKVGEYGLECSSQQGPYRYPEGRWFVE